MPIKAKTKPDPDWRIFEMLSTRLVSQAFNLKPAMVLVTKKSKDGGYDGIVLNHLTRERSLLGRIDDLTFVEAKLRSGSTGIGLRDFAATLVVAHNEYANTLVVVTNRPFTPQALEEACRFFARTNMRVKLVDGATVSGWVRRNFDGLAAEFPKSFLRGLILDDPAAEKAKRDVFNCSRPSRLFPGFGEASDKKYVVESGWYEDSRLADCDLLVEEAHGVGKQLLLPLISNERTVALDKLASTLGESGRICLLTGTGGVGKSVLVSHLVARLGECPSGPEKPWIGQIDVGREKSSRGLFVSILTALLGVDAQALTAEGDDYWEPETLVSRLGNTAVDDPVCKAVVRSLKADLRAYESSWDLNVEPLLVFLARLVRKRTEYQRITLIFHELNRSTEETLDFLLQACRVLGESNASILVEIRDAGYERTATTRRFETTTVMSLDEWQQMVARFRGLANWGEVRLDPPSDGEAVGYLQSLLPGLGPQQAAVVVRHVGTIPLHLSLTARWHQSEGILARRDGGIYLVEDLERFFVDQQITPSSVDIIFDRLIEAWWSRPSKIYRQAITAASLFQGELSLTTVSALDADVDTEDLADELVASGLFQKNFKSSGALKVAHDLVLDRMEEFVKGRSFVVAGVARNLLGQLDAIIIGPQQKRLREVDLLTAIGAERIEEAARRAHSVAQDLAQTRDWSQAAKYFERAAKALAEWRKDRDGDEPRILELQILADWLEVEILRYRIGLTENRNRLSKFLTLLNFSPDLILAMPEAARHALALRAAIIEWRYHYVHEHIADALRVSARGRDLALACSEETDIELRGKALANHATTLKIADARQDSIRAFDEALKCLPSSYTVVAERLSNLAAAALSKRPEQALAYYRQLLKVTEGTPYSFSEIIHAHVDVAMAEFLMNDLTAAERDAQCAIKLAVDNGVPAQEARGRNILGCVYWIAGKLKSADQQFEEAAFASERSISHRFLWRMRTNAAGTALALNDLPRCYGYARSAEDAILKPREASFVQAEKDPSYVSSRWYVALIAIASYYAAMEKREDLDRLFDRVLLPRFREHAQRYIGNDPAPEVFEGTTHLQGGIIMITG